MPTALILAGGAPGSTGFDGADFVIAADSGLHRASGRRVDLVIGDLDSVEPKALAAAETAGADVRRHPATKNETDLELAMEAALDWGADRIVVEGGLGGRLDHLLNVASVITADRWAEAAVEWWDDDQQALVVRTKATLAGRVGETVSLVPFGGPASGITLSGFAYPLADETLLAGSGRGLSNVVTADPARISLTDGVLLVVFAGIQP